MKALFLLFSITLLLEAKAFSQNDGPPAFEISTDTITYFTLPYSKWQYFIEKDQKLTFKDVIKPPVSAQFARPDSPVIKTSLPSGLWVRYKIKNNLPTRLGITLPEEGKRADFYLSETAGSWKHYITGTYVPWSKRDGLKKMAQITYTIPANGEVTVYEREENAVLDAHTRYFVGTQANVIAENYAEDDVSYGKIIRYAITAGFLLFAAIFNFFFYWIVREKVYLTYSILLLFGTLIPPPLYALFFREFPEYGFQIRPLLESVIMYLCIITILKFLQVSKNHPVWNKWLLIASRLYIILIAIIIFYTWKNTLRLLRINLVSGPPLYALILLYCLLFIFIVGFITIIVTDLIKKQHSTRLFLLAITPLLFVPILSTFNITIPYMNEIPVVWAISVISWSLFERFSMLLNENANQALERERIFREKETERSQLIAQHNERLEQQVTERTAELSRSLTKLKQTQSQLIQSEKMASLGQLTAGIAHEIQNPLNFVNNFSEVSTELIDEMKDALQKNDQQEAGMIADDIKENLQKINYHGKRADGIVKNMLQHSRTGSGKMEPTDINTLADECLRLSYQGLKTKDKSFSADLKCDFDESIEKIEVIPQDIGRVFLNLFNNALYAVHEKKKQHGQEYMPTVWVSTKKSDDGIEIVVKDNGSGIPKAIADKIFQPFFTTKPTGQGTGLGLSLSYDIINAHGGSLTAESVEGEFAKFIITLPR